MSSLRHTFSNAGIYFRSTVFKFNLYLSLTYIQVKSKYGKLVTLGWIKGILATPMADNRK